MADLPSDIEHLKAVYATARNKYRPKHIRVLLIGEAPPCALDRFFYFEDVKKQDSLFLEIMGSLYPDQKKQYLGSGRDTELKKDLLETFQSDGYWLLDLYETPVEESGNEVQLLLEKLKKLVTKDTCIILIKANIYDLCYTPLTDAGYKVINERIPFPGSGQQGVFREKFGRAIQVCG
jgi:hypothetical protein